MTLKSFTSDFLEALISDADKSPRFRQHLNMHSSYADPCQRLLNAIGINSYIRPHRHSIDPKTETLAAIKGLFALVTFDDVGNMQEIIRFGTEKYCEKEPLAVGVELTPDTWHTVIALVPGSVLMELKAGPFNPNAAKESALWAPEEQSHEGEAFVKRLRTAVEAKINETP